MSRYYFDSENGGKIFDDADGVELRTRNAARNEAVNILSEMVSDAPFDENRGVFAVRVRDESGRIIFRGRLSLDAGWCA